MQVRDNAERYGVVTRWLHWGTAALIALMLVLGWGAEVLPENVEESLMSVHVSVGIAVLALALLRVFWRIVNPRRPARPGGVEGKAARWVQRLLVAVLLALPLSGWLIVSAAGFGPGFFGLFTLPPLVGESEWLHEVGEEIHEILPWVLVTVLILHVAGALKHHFVDADGTLQRMLAARSQESA
ncbi:cytochrome b [Ectothiorhodospiraceae bacterium WFHF3C12]|nr:cytochrome b [Ectothiorhodospiraceae bacterium WFHF3C12]